MFDGVTDREKISQKELRELIESCFRGQEWIPVNYSYHAKHDSVGVFCELVPNCNVSHCLSTPGWDLTKNHIGPSCFMSLEGAEEVIEYSRYSTSNEIEPLIIPRNFHGVRESYVELSEEFRLFHNLFYDKITGNYLKIDDAGIAHEIARVREGIFEIRRKEIREYLGIREMTLILQFDCVKYSPTELFEIDENRRSNVETQRDYCYSFNTIAYKDYDAGIYKTLSSLYGKCAILGYPKEKCNFGPFESRIESYPEFIIGIDEDDQNVTASCNPEKLDRSKKGMQSYLTQVYFQGEVLTKYFGNDSLYSVEDGYLSCGGLWGLDIDNQNKDYIVVFLGDLGESLPSGEREYWKSFNIPPQGGMSKTAIMRSIMGVFADPEKADLRFRLEYSRFNKAWKISTGWTFYIPFMEGDAHLSKLLRIPLTESQSEFDEQLLYLTKMLVDSLNEKEIRKHTSDIEKNTKGIMKLSAHLKQINYPKGEEVIEFLRLLQNVRSTGVAHRKGTRYAKALKSLSIDSKALKLSFEGILNRAISVLTGLGKFIEGSENVR